jgi:hypothetical protein
MEDWRRRYMVPDCLTGRCRTAPVMACGDIMCDGYGLGFKETLDMTDRGFFSACNDRHGSTGCK